MTEIIVYRPEHFGGVEALYAVAVLKSYRRAGVGADLVREAERLLQALGCTKINLQVRSTNAEVIGFYGRLGYGTEDRVSMGKRVASGITTLNMGLV